VSVEPIDVDQMRSLARLLGVELDAEGEAPETLALELEELLAEGRIYAELKLGDLSPSVEFQPRE
jgi:hypothetical protein